MRKRLMCVMAAALMLSGCASESIEYVNDGTAESSEKRVEETADKQSVSNDEKTTEASTEVVGISDISWIEDIKIRGGKDEVHISATTKELQADEKYKIITAREITEFSSEEKEKFLKNLFTESDIYIFDEEHLPKYILEDRIKRYEEYAQNAGDNEAIMQSWREAIAEIKGVIDESPDEFILAESFEGNEYLAYFDNMLYQISFCLNQKTYMNINDIVKNGIDSYIKMYLREDLMKPEEREQIEYNTKLKIEDMTLLADKMVEKLDFEDINYYKTSKYGYATGALANDNYKVEYYQGAKVFPDNNGPLRVDKNGNEYFTGSNRGIEVYIDRGIISGMSVCFPIEIIDVEEDVELVDFETIQDAIREKILHDNEDLFWDTPGYATGNKPFMIRTDMVLGYAYVPEENDMVKLIPCWMFAGLSGGTVYPIVVNAIDGKVIEDYWWDHSIEIYNQTYN